MVASGRAVIRGSGVGSQIEMKAQGVLELRHQRCRELPHASADPLDRHRANLLCLRLGVETQFTFRSWEEHLKGIYAGHIGGHGHDGNDTSSES